MTAVFYIAAVVAVVSTALMISQPHPVHALLYLIVSLLAVAAIFYTLGAPLIAALEVIIYAGAIAVLLLFVVMMLNLGQRTARREIEWMSARSWLGAGVLGFVLLAQVAYVLWSSGDGRLAAATIGPVEVGTVLLGPYLVGVELASLLLLAGLVGAYHLGRPDRKDNDGGPPDGRSTL